MKVLICGEYGIYCRELISRLKKEKHDIFVITGSGESPEGETKIRSFSRIQFQLPE